MASAVKKLRAVAFMSGQLFNGLCAIAIFSNGTHVKASMENERR